MPSVDNDTVLKNGVVRHIVKTMDAMSKKNDGSMTLYNNRLVWKGGKGDIEIPVNDIKMVEIKTYGGDSMLEILTNNGNNNKFMIVGNVMQNVLLAGATRGSTSVTSRLQARAELESWRDAIEKVRGRL
jgi:hypothetical protein